jgi:hypothetical protein
VLRRIKVFTIMESFTPVTGGMRFVGPERRVMHQRPARVASHAPRVPPRSGTLRACRPAARRYTWTNSMPVSWQNTFQSAAW